MEQLIRSAAVTAACAPPSRGETTLFKADEDHVVQPKANKTVFCLLLGGRGIYTPLPPSVGMYMESLISEEWKHSGADQSPSISASRHCSILPGRLSIDPRCNLQQYGHPPALPPPRFRDSFNWIKEGLPQNFVPAVTAPVPLTAVQVTDANLLKSKKKGAGLTSSSLEESATAAPCAAASLRFHLSTLAHAPRQPLKERVLQSVLKLLADSITSQLPSWIEEAGGSQRGQVARKARSSCAEKPQKKTRQKKVRRVVNNGCCC